VKKKWDPPTGEETEEPSGLNRLEALAWRVEHQLACVALSTSRGIGAEAQDYFLRNPTRPCERCAGKGAVWSGVPDLGTCSACRGLGYFKMTLAEIRSAYREIRVHVCEGNAAITPGDFDREATTMAKDRQPKDTSAGLWLWAAREIARREEVKRAERRRQARGRW
jgi:hypothetical protein